MKNVDSLVPAQYRAIPQTATTPEQNENRKRLELMKNIEKGNNALKKKEERLKLEAENKKR